MRKLLILLFTFVSFGSFAQLENANWCFPYLAKVSFNTVPPTPGVSANDNNSFINHYGITCASVSSSSGALLFYTDGVRVWDKTNNIMQNGTNIGGGIATGWAEQGVLIVPKPGSQTIYYIFTACKFTDYPPSNQNHTGYHYSVVDISLNGGNGAVVINDIPLKDELGQPIDFDHATGTGLQIYETSMTSTINNTGDKIWVTIIARFHESGVVKRMAYSYLVGPDGINHYADGTGPMPNASTPLVVRCPLLSSWCTDYGGSIKISPNGLYLCNEAKDIVELYNYDNSTGLLSYDHVVFNGAPVIARPGYGIEFSPNSQLIYFSTYDCGLCQGKPAPTQENGGGDQTDRKNYIRIRQANVIKQKGEEPNIIVGEFEVPASKGKSSGSGNDIISLPGTTYGELQLAPDGKIYACSFNYSISPPGANLGVINQPNVQGVNCQYVNNGITLASGTEQYGSLPQWVHKIPNVWPKVYTYASHAWSLYKDNSHNIFLSFNGDVSQAINNIGPLPAPTGTTSFLTFKYGPNAVTDWFRQVPFIATPMEYYMNNGNVQCSDLGYLSITSNYYSSASGSVAAPPSIVPSTHKIWSETSTGGYITTSGSAYNDLLNYIAPSGSITNIPLSAYPCSFYTKYNPATNNLFVISYIFIPNQATQYSFKVFHFNGSAFNLLYEVAPPNYIPYEIIQIDNNDQVYVWKDYKIQKHNYITNTYAPVSISNFNNNDIRISYTSNTYTDNRCLVLNDTEGNMYSLDLVALTSKKINFSGIYFESFSRYLYDGDDVYFSSFSRIPRPDGVIGTQIIPQLDHSIFLTKLNLTSDFSFRQAQDPSFAQNKNTLGMVVQKTADDKPLDLIASLSPNPVKDRLSINIDDNAFSAVPGYQVAVYNSLGIKIITQRYTTKSFYINTMQLKSGKYVISIMNQKGQTISRSFIKI